MPITCGRDGEKIVGVDDGNIVTSSCESDCRVFGGRPSVRHHCAGVVQISPAAWQNAEFIGIGCDGGLDLAIVEAACSVGSD